MVNKLPENLKYYRRLHNMSQKDLGDILNKTPNVISNWERGENSPDIEIVLQLCEIFGCNPNQLFGYEEDKELKILVEIDTLEKQKSEIQDRLVAYYRKLQEYQTLKAANELIDEQMNSPEYLEKAAEEYKRTIEET